MTFRAAIVLVLVCAPLVAESQQSGTFQGARTVRTAATIQSVSQSDRRVTLLDRDGTKLTVQAGSGVKNLDEIKPGEKVVVVYQEGVLAEVGGPRSATSADVPPDRGQRAVPAGDTPVTGTVRIEAVDIAEHTVTFVRADGEKRKLAVVRPDAKRFIETLKPGDQVRVTYREPVALSIEPGAG